MFGLFEPNYKRIGFTTERAPILRARRPVAGPWQAPTLFTIGIILVFEGFCFVAACLFLARDEGYTFRTTWTLVGMFLMAIGVSTIGSAVSTWSLRRRIRRLVSASDIKKRFGMTENNLASIAEREDIRPHYRINDEDYYDLAEFGEAALLLRPSVPPSEPKAALLLPAACAGSNERMLLRPALDESEVGITARKPVVGGALGE